MRAHLGLALGAAVLIASLVAAGDHAAVAEQGQAIIAGVGNSESNETKLYNTNTHTGESCSSGAGFSGGLLACGHFGLTGRGISYGVSGTAEPEGNAGVGGSGPIGVAGAGSEIGVSGTSSEIGVEAQGDRAVVANGDTTGVEASGAAYGVFTTGRTGVYSQGTGGGVIAIATDPNGIGVFASGPTALSVSGKAEFSRSGRAVVPGTRGSPKASVFVPNVALSADSLILVTPQRQVGGVWVTGAVPQPANNRFRIFLNKAVSVSYPVAWMIVEHLPPPPDDGHPES